MRTVALAAALAVFALLFGSNAEACAISLVDGGELALSPEGDTLTSEAGDAATLTTIIPSLTSVTVEVSAPERVQSPALYDAAGESVEVSYHASVLGLVELRSQPFTAAATSFASGVLGLGTLTVTIVMHNRIVNPGGFAAGTYATRTVVTCHP